MRSVQLAGRVLVGDQAGDPKRELADHLLVPDEHHAALQLDDAVHRSSHVA